MRDEGISAGVQLSALYGKLMLSIIAALVCSVVFFRDWWRVVMILGPGSVMASEIPGLYNSAMMQFCAVRAVIEGRGG